MRARAEQGVLKWYGHMLKVSDTRLMKSVPLGGTV